jgi:hypothetical protein
MSIVILPLISSPSYSEKNELQIIDLTRKTGALYVYPALSLKEAIFLPSTLLNCTIILHGGEKPKIDCYKIDEYLEMAKLDAYQHISLDCNLLL